MQKARLVILISGRGSNMQAIATACASGELAAEVVLVVSNRADAKGLEIARTMGIDTAVIPHTDFSSRSAFELALIQRIEPVNPDWLVLAGFMRILGAAVIDRWEGRMLNIHPSLLPKYPGLNTHAQAIAAGDQETGASVHLLTAELDAGPVIAQVRVPIHPDDTPQTLSQRVLEQEHRLYVDALKQCVTVTAP
jgi:phosphoribosylglycinamide formyltransferase-1